MSTVLEQSEKHYDPNDHTLKFVKGKDEITGDDDPNILRAEMSCKHAVDPNSLTAWCRSLLDRENLFPNDSPFSFNVRGNVACFSGSTNDYPTTLYLVQMVWLQEGQYKFYCPALKDGTTEKCGQEWPYHEVRKLAVLTNEEQRHFEETVAVLAAAEYCEYKSCPGCGTFVERTNLNNLNVCCIICTAEKGNAYEFCWQCMKPWKGPGPRSDRCDNEGCTNVELDTLRNCPLISLCNSVVKNCPSIRACPTCGKLLEHSQKGCKNIFCCRCNVEFCFVCLELTQTCQAKRPGSWYNLCAKGIAPRQTSIPMWNRNGSQ